jgi:hypothetical protein
MSTDESTEESTFVEQLLHLTKNYHERRGKGDTVRFLAAVSSYVSCVYLGLDDVSRYVFKEAMKNFFEDPTKYENIAKEYLPK